MNNEIQFSITTLVHSFLRGNVRNQWLYGLEGKIYVRRRKRIHPHKAGFIDTFDLATIIIDETSCGTFTNFLDWLEGVHPDLNLCIESIQTQRFMEFFKRRGYIIKGEDFCWDAWKLSEL